MKTAHFPSSHMMVIYTKSRNLKRKCRSEPNLRMLAINTLDEAASLRPYQVPAAEAKQYQKEVIKHFENVLTSSQRATAYFPGATPVSLMRDEIESLYTSPHLVSLKADGVRYMLLLTVTPSNEPVALFVNRSFEFFEVSVWCEESFFAQGSLFDGELVADQGNTFTYLLFDCISVCGKSMVKTKYSERLTYVQALFDCISDTKAEQNDAGEERSFEEFIIQHNKIVAGSQNPLTNISFRPKPFLQLDKGTASSLWHKRGSFPFFSDGLIFTPSDSPVTAMRDVRCKKWKNTHTIDITLILGSHDTTVAIGSNAKQELQSSAVIPGFSEQEYTMHIIHNVITDGLPKGRHVVECTVDIVTDTHSLYFSPIKMRSDKPVANSIYTVGATLTNILQAVDITEL